MRGLLRVSRLDGRKRGREGERDGYVVQREKRNPKNREREGGRGGWVDEINRGRGEK